MPEFIKGYVLCISASDTGAGAGMQADIKTIAALGGYGLSALTALTVQDSQQVHDILPLSPLFIAKQIAALMADFRTDIVKTGMIADKASVEVIAESLAQNDPELARVIDPVIMAGSGQNFLDRAGREAMQALLFPNATLITPNTLEAEVFTNKAVQTIDGQRRAAEAFLEGGAKAVLVKGGHLQGDEVTDVLQTEYGEYFYTSQRLEGKNNHGTGCTLASATATLLAQGKALDIAVGEARDYIMQAMIATPEIGQVNGPLNHFWHLKI